MLYHESRWVVGENKIKYNITFNYKLNTNLSSGYEKISVIVVVAVVGNEVWEE